MIEPRWIASAFAIELNRRLVEFSGEPFLLRDEGLLESALAVPQNRWHYEQVDDIGLLGLSLAVAVARNHPFGQGNKRTAWAAMLAFFAMNGVAMLNEDDTRHAEAFIAVLTGDLPAERLLEAMIIAEA
ncbi:type II toxin-antitoxin system death-on-curing family toxin [Starkeya koreensis]|uniref:Type II toxin-antitoxin system death-on-curing family toxin n=1 Tax=Ancylobacter koreensis TaxID=266121 RepID=A0ABT0DK50_9HYPH|nr:type II toxin-antitoxin system death-on-curing family toxin [Ancylobacter koreensis]